MGIKQDHSGLPRDVAAGRTRDDRPRYVTALAKAWYEEWLKDGDKPHAVPGTRFRASDAGSCTRALAYKQAKEPFTNPPTIADAWSMGLGSLIHEELEAPLKRAFPSAEVEVKVDCRPMVDLSASIDVVVRIPRADLEAAAAGVGDLSLDAHDMLALMDDDEDAFIELVELKTVGGYGYKMSIGAVRKSTPAEGPKLSAVLQVSLAGAAIGAHRVVTGSLGRETISKNVAKTFGLDDIDRFAAEWTFTRDEFMPLALGEAARLNWLSGYIDGLVEKAKEHSIKVDGFEMETPVALKVASKRVPRLIEVKPAKVVRITDPEKGAWQQDGLDGIILDAGDTWHCGYCWHRDLCLQDGA